jgi:hypothetical protein
MKKIAAVLVLLSASCARQPSAAEVCAKLEAAGIARGCHEVKPGGISAGARERVDFDLVSVPGKGAGVMSYDSPEAYEACVKAHEAAAIIVGPHRYGSAKARIFVQMNEGASLEVGKKTRAIVEGL